MHSHVLSTVAGVVDVDVDQAALRSSCSSFRLRWWWVGGLLSTCIRRRISKNS